MSNLFFWKFSEEINFFFTRRFPIIISFESTLQMRFNINIKCLGFQLWIRWIINTRNALGWCKMVEVGSQLMEFCPCCLFLKFCFFQCCFSCKVFKLFSYFLIFSCNMVKITFPCIKVMFIFSAIVTTIEFLYYFCLFVKESGLLIFIFIFFFWIELETASISSPNSLDHNHSPLFILKFPFLPKHALPFLNPDSSCIVFFPFLISFVYFEKVLVYNASVPFFSFS